MTEMLSKYSIECAGAVESCLKLNVMCAPFAHDFHVETLYDGQAQCCWRPLLILWDLGFTFIKLN